MPGAASGVSFNVRADGRLRDIDACFLMPCVWGGVAGGVCRVQLVECPSVYELMVEFKVLMLACFGLGAVRWWGVPGAASGVSFGVRADGRLRVSMGGNP